jgi:hypothetical protein
MDSSLFAPAKLSRHAVTRMSQRSYGLHDVELIRQFGTPVRAGYLLTRSDIESLARDLRRLERIEGTMLVEQAGTMVTVYRPGKKRRQRIVRDAI